MYRGSFTHSPLEIQLKNAFWRLSSGFLVTVVLLRAKTYHKTICRSYSLRPSDPDAKISAGEVRACAESKISRVFRFNCLGFRCLFSPLFLLLLPHFFSFAGHLVGFILVGTVFRKAFRILGLGEIKGRAVVDRGGTRFSWRFSGQCYMVFGLFLRCP